MWSDHASLILQHYSVARQWTLVTREKVTLCSTNYAHCQYAEKCLVCCNFPFPPFDSVDLGHTCGDRDLSARAVWKPDGVCNYPSTVTGADSLIAKWWFRYACYTLLGERGAFGGLPRVFVSIIAGPKIESHEHRIVLGEANLQLGMQANSFIPFRRCVVCFWKLKRLFIKCFNVRLISPSSANRRQCCPCA